MTATQFNNQNQDQRKEAISSYRSLLEEKVNKLLGSKLEGKFQAIVAPQGFHWSTTYGLMSYVNPGSLMDVDRMLVFDEDGQASFGNEEFSKLYKDILENTGFQYSEADQRKLDDLKNKASLETQNLVRAYTEDGLSISNPQNPLIEIVGFVTEHQSDPNFDSIYPHLSAEYNVYLGKNKEYINLTKKQIDAMNYVGQLIDNMNEPSEKNGGVQVSADKWSVGYSLPTAGQLYADLQSKNSLEIEVEVYNFDGEQSELSIDHQSPFIVPLPIFIFGKSDTKYTLNSLATASSKVTIHIQFNGIGALDASPIMVDAAKTYGWYDENVLVEIKDKTGKNETGYCFANDEMKVDDLFGKRLNRLKEFVISQDPIIQITISNAQTEKVEKCFQHDSELDIDFFGFAISSSQHHYSVESCDIDTKSNTATITLSAPAPSSGGTQEDEVCYVLGGVPSYPPEAANDTILQNTVHSPSFTCLLPSDVILDYVRRYLPRGYHCKDVKRVGSDPHDYYCVFTSQNNITQLDMRQWITTALEGKGNFRFDS